MTKLKLPKLPDRTPVKMTIQILPDLADALHKYAAAYQQAYGTSEAVADLVPYMLAVFLESDREFARSAKS
jgi:hypothetical protein